MLAARLTGFGRTQRLPGLSARYRGDNFHLVRRLDPRHLPERTSHDLTVNGDRDAPHRDTHIVQQIDKTSRRREVVSYTINDHFVTSLTKSSAACDVRGARVTPWRKCPDDHAHR